MEPTRRLLLQALPAFATAALILPFRPNAATAKAAVEPWAAKLIAAGQAQIGVTVLYDPAYVALSYPRGDIPPNRGVCTDVIIRAYRDAFDVDLQKLVHEDMRAAFSSYPKTWRLSRPDHNIDHRRVPNLATFFGRVGVSLPVTDDPLDYLPGDLVTQRLPAGQPHIALVSDVLAAGTGRPLLIHNIGAGARQEDTLLAFRNVGHYRFPPKA